MCRVQIVMKLSSRKFKAVVEPFGVQTWFYCLCFWHLIGYMMRQSYSGWCVREQRVGLLSSDYSLAVVGCRVGRDFHMQSNEVSNKRSAVGGHHRINLMTE